MYLLPRFCFLHCLWLSLLARIKLKTLAGRTCLSAPQHPQIFSVIFRINSSFSELLFDSVLSFPYSSRCVILFFVWWFIFSVSTPHVAGNCRSRSSGFSSLLLHAFQNVGQFSFLTNLCFLSQSRHVFCCLCSVQSIIHFLLMAWTLSVWSSPFIVFVWAIRKFFYFSLELVWLTCLFKEFIQIALYFFITFVIISLSSIVWMRCSRILSSLLSPNSQESNRSLSLIAYSEIVSLFSCLILLNKYLACYLFCFGIKWYLLF